MSDQPSADIPSAPSTASTLSSSRRQPLASAAHLHFADNLPSSASDLPGPRSAGRRTPQHPPQTQRRNSRPLSADPLLPGSPHERRASLAASSAAYTTAPSSATARRTSFGRGRSATARHLRREDAELFDFGEATSVSTSGSPAAKMGFGNGISEEDEFQQRLARIDLDRVMQAIQASPPRTDFVPAAAPPTAMNTPPSMATTRRTSSYGMAGSPLKENVQLSPSPHGTPDRDHKRGLKDFFGTKAKPKDRPSLADEEERLRREEMQRIERVRHIHAALTPSTVSRAESAKSQFEARYNLLLSPSHKPETPAAPSFLSLVKWKKSVREMDRLRRRSEQAASRAALGRGIALSRANSGASSANVRQKSPSDPPTEPSSRRASFNVQQDQSTDTVSHWAEQLILAKHRRKQSVLSGNNSLSMPWESSGTFGRPSDWDFTAHDIMEYLACHGEVQRFVVAPGELGAESEIRTSGEQAVLDLERIPESPRVGSGGQSTNLGKSAPPSVLSLMSVTSDSTGDIPQLRATRQATQAAPPPLAGKRALSSLNEDELDSQAESAILPQHQRKRRAPTLSAPDSPVSGRKPKYTRTQSGGGRPGSISQAIGSLFSGSGSLEMVGAGGAGGAGGGGAAPGSSRQSLTGKMWAAGRGGAAGRRSLEEAGTGLGSRDRSPAVSESENVASGGEDNTSGVEAGRRAQGGRRRGHRKVPGLTFTKREEAGVEDESARKARAAEQRKKRVPAIVVPELPKRPTREEEEERAAEMESEDEEEDYETKSRVLSGLLNQLKHMDDVLASSRIRNLAQELIDMRDQTFALQSSASIVLPPLPNDVRTMMPRPRMHEVLQSIAAQTVEELRSGNFGLGLPRSSTMPLPSRDDSTGKIAPAFMPVSRSLSAPTDDQDTIDVVPQIEHGLAELKQQWMEVDQRLDQLFAEQTLAFDTHKAAQMDVDRVETMFFEESRLMDRLDDRIHRLKTRNLGNSFLFSFLATLAEVLLFTVWFFAKIIQLIIFKIPKFLWRCLVRFVFFLWWLIRWILFLDYLWP